jgi:hypothetical protein
MCYSWEIVFTLTVIKESRWESTSMIEQSSIFFRVEISIVSFSILFFNKTRIMFSRFMISESIQNDVLSLAKAEIEIEIEILTSISWREEKDLISKSVRLRLRLVWSSGWVLSESGCSFDPIERVGHSMLFDVSSWVWVSVRRSSPTRSRGARNLR